MYSTALQRRLETVDTKFALQQQEVGLLRELLEEIQSLLFRRGEETCHGEEPETGEETARPVECTAAETRGATAEAETRETKNTREGTLTTKGSGGTTHTCSERHSHTPVT